MPARAFEQGAAAAVFEHRVDGRKHKGDAGDEHHGRIDFAKAREKDDDARQDHQRRYDIEVTGQHERAAHIADDEYVVDASDYQQCREEVDEDAGEDVREDTHAETQHKACDRHDAQLCLGRTVAFGREAYIEAVGARYDECDAYEYRYPG